MNKRIKPLFLLFCVAAVLQIGPCPLAGVPALAGGEDEAPWPTDDWAVSTPEEQGMDRDILIDAFKYAIRNRSKAVIVIRNGYIVGEWYGSGWNEQSRQQCFSMTKSLSSAVIGMLIDDGAVSSVEDRVARYVPEWRDSLHRYVTIRDLLSMVSGLHWDYISDYFILPSRYDQTAYALNRKMDHIPGTVWVYSNTACQVLSAVIEEATGVQAADYAQDRLFDVIGMRETTWLSDDAGNTLTYMGIISSAREFAKFGYLFLRDGRWEDGRVISDSWVEESTSQSQELLPVYGYLWWLNTGSNWMPDAPPDTYMALGANEKKLYIVPGLDVIAVRLGAGESEWSDNAFLGPVCSSVIR